MAHRIEHFIDNILTRHEMCKKSLVRNNNNKLIDLNIVTLKIHNT